MGLGASVPRRRGRGSFCVPCADSRNAISPAASSIFSQTSHGDNTDSLSSIAASDNSEADIQVVNGEVSPEVPDTSRCKHSQVQDCTKETDGEDTNLEIESNEITNDTTDRNPEDTNLNVSEKTLRDSNDAKVKDTTEKNSDDITFESDSELSDDSLTLPSSPSPSYESDPEIATGPNSESTSPDLSDTDCEENNAHSIDILRPLAWTTENTKWLAFVDTWKRRSKSRTEFSLVEATIYPFWIPPGGYWSCPKSYWHPKEFNFLPRVYNFLQGGVIPAPIFPQDLPAFIKPFLDRAIRLQVICKSDLAPTRDIDQIKALMPEFQYLARNIRYLRMLIRCQTCKRGKTKLSVILHENHGNKHYRNQQRYRSLLPKQLDILNESLMIKGNPLKRLSSNLPQPQKQDQFGH